MATAVATASLTPKSIILFADVAPSATAIVPFVDVRKVTTLESGSDSVA